MKSLFIFFLFITQFTFSQDTTDVYVINNTNKLVAINAASGKRAYAIFYRDLQHVKQVKRISFESDEKLVKFFDTCDKALAKNMTIVTNGYTIKRNNLSKKVARVNDEEDGYFLLKESTLDSMRKAHSVENK